MQKSLGFVAVQARGGIITIPAEARRALRLDEPGAQLEVILRDDDLLLVPHLAVPLEQFHHRDGKTSAEPHAVARDDAGYAVAAAAERPAARPENMQPPRNVPSRDR
jgi:AbrB family looped-hinge helix DNA binding protein